MYKLSNLHYQFHGWLGDDILESFPCCIVTELLQKAIEAENLTSIGFAEVFISKSGRFLDLC
jgi:hypothetical protein